MGEEIVERTLDEALVEDGVDAVLLARAVGGEIGTLGAAGTELADLRARRSNERQKIAAEQLSQSNGVDLVGFDFGFGDGVSFERVGDGHFKAEGLEEGGDGPAVCGGFQRSAGTGFVYKSGFDLPFVNIEAGKKRHT